MQIDFLQNIIKTKDYDLFSRKYSQIYKKLDTDILESLIPLKSDDNIIFFRTLEILLIFKNKKFVEVCSYVENNIKGLLLGKMRSYDICISKILRMYYLSRKELEMNNDIFFSLMVPNKELGNEESVSVITNCLLDYLISNNIYKKIENKIVQSEISRYNLYNGIIELVEGNYDLSYQLLDSTIKNTSGNHSDKKMVLNKKYLILASLLQSKYNISVVFDKRIKIYFDLIKIVKEADLQAYNDFISTYRDTLLKENTYFLVLRLSQNVIQEKIRCMSIIYSRISFDDMSIKLNIDKEDLDYILKKSIIHLGLISGRVENDIYYACKNDKKVRSKFTFENINNINKLLKKEMKYPQISPLCYENTIQ